MRKEAKFWKTISDGKVQCNLCNHSCKIDENNVGICKVRKNEGGCLKTLIYGTCSSVAVDPIEKKPLFHFYPSSNVLSLGTVGCNFKCSHCQNYGISTADLDYSNIRELKPDQVIQMAKKNRCQGIAWTYNEPSIWHEYTYDVSKLAKENDLYTVYVSNGYMSEGALKEISPYLDAINIDVKAFTDEFYKRVCKARLEPVLQTCKLAKELKIHLEITYLIIPTLNDSDDEITSFCSWVKHKLGRDIPIHFSRFHPDHKMREIEPTPINTMLKAYDLAKKEGILYPYLGNITLDKYENTICPKCGNLCVQREGFFVNLDGLIDGKCAKCDNIITPYF